jgi:DHA1 family bicyclomycin/chloramphenicol resistance-like MFS transporter
MSNRLYDRTTPPHITTLVLATATTSLATNIILPSLPGMARDFGADYSVMQLAVTLFLAATAVLQVLIGPASDRLGRRPVMLACFTIFIVSTIAALYAPDVWTFLVCRMLQAFSAAGIVLSRAIVRDTVGPAEAASKIGYVTMGMAIAPMIAPFIGGLLDEAFDWHATFVFLLVFGVLSLAAIYFDLGETNHSPSANFAAQFRAYPSLIRSRLFWGYTLTAGFTSGAFFAFVGGAPYVASEMLGLSPSDYGMYFGVVAGGYLIGNFASGRWSTRAGINRMMFVGNVIASAGMVVAIILFAVGFMHPVSLFGPCIFIGLGNGFTLPNSNAGIVSVRPDLAGSASGLGGALQLGFGALLSFLAGITLSPETGPYPLLLIMLCSALAGLLATVLVMRASRA